MQNEIYAAVSQITEGRERDGSYHGNGHHLAQEITKAVTRVIAGKLLGVIDCSQVLQVCKHCVAKNGPCKK